MIWDTEAECMDAGERKKLQSERLVKLVERIYAVPFYKKKMDAAKLKPGDIKSIDDIVKLPFTDKEELRTTYPYGVLCVPEKEIIEIHQSSGTTGTPIVAEYTKNDVETWTEAVARSVAGHGITEDDIIQICQGFGLFTGGLGYYAGYRRLGAKVIPMGSGNTPQQLKMIQDFHTTEICCTTTYAMHLAEAAKDAGLDPRKFSVRHADLGAEPWSEELRKDIEEAWDMKAYDVYGLTEITGPGVSFECLNQDGLHINEDLFYPEVVDPDTGEVLPDGKTGELVFTTLVKEGTPMLRYRTRDLTGLRHEQCSCGRTLVKMERTMGRTDDMLIIRGTNVYPVQIEQILFAADGTAPQYTITIDREKTALDNVEIQIEMSEEFFKNSRHNAQHLKKKLEDTLRSELKVRMNVTLAEPRTLERFVGKAKRVIDKRKI
ncbi:MAG: phenylacetate--CoA ligase [Treponema sp.]|jgi:phenylacetate-CoA ligase|nr:phenylacetate--CoA ligase [Treponema sp.]